MSEGRLAQEARACGIEVKVIDEREYPFWQIVYQATRFVKTRKIQVLHSHRYKENLLATLLAKRCQIPHLVRTLHGHPEPGGFKQWLVYVMDRATARFAAERVVSVSSNLTEYLRGHVDEERITIIPNGIDLGAVCSKLSHTEAKRQLGIAEDAPVIGIAARLELVKRIDLFLRAAKEIARQFPNARFVIVGRGSCEPRLRQVVSAAGLQDSVLFLGHRDDVYDALAAFDVLLVTSDHEGLPMVVLEAMAMSIPVVSRDVGGIPELIEHGVTGLLVPSADEYALASTCTSVLRDGALRQRLTRTARELVHVNYSAERNAADVVKLYRSLMESDNGS
jgi:glycosyltransferase involved in cell wall biosynthesis